MQTPLHFVYFIFDNPLYSLGRFLICVLIVMLFGAVWERRPTKLNSIVLIVLGGSLVLSWPLILTLGMMQAFFGIGRTVLFLYTGFVGIIGFYFGMRVFKKYLPKGTDEVSPNISVSRISNEEKALIYFSPLGHVLSFLFQSGICGSGAYIGWLGIQSLLPNLFPSAATELRYYFNSHDNFLLALFHGSLCLGCFYYGKAMIFKYVPSDHKD